MYSIFTEPMDIRSHLAQVLGHLPGCSTSMESQDRIIAGPALDREPGQVVDGIIAGGVAVPRGSRAVVLSCCRGMVEAVVVDTVVVGAAML